MMARKHSQILRTIPFLIATCHCERSVAIRFRVWVATAVFLLAIVSTATAKYSGGSGTAQDPYQIATVADLMALGETPGDYDKHFLLTADIDLDPKLPGRKIFYEAVIAPARVRLPLRDVVVETPFTGVLDGNGHTISHLAIKGGSYVGLFGGLASAAEVKDIGVVDVNITGSGGSVGGLVGNNGGTVVQCYSTGAIIAVEDINGNGWGIYVGGLVGSNRGTVTECYSTGAVSGSGWWDVGGLVGFNGGTVTCCYSKGTVSGTDGVGGLVGENDGSLTDCYSTGAVSGTWYVGGLVGCNNGGRVHQCYSTGAVSGTGQYVGGLVGSNTDTWGSQAVVTACFWNAQTSGQTTSAGGTGKTTAQMHDPNTFRTAGWDFVGEADGPDDIWAEPQGGGYPILWWQLSPWASLPRFSGGTGEPNDPYRISTAKDLNSIGHNPRLMKCDYKLVANLDLTGSHFYPIGHADYPYGGVFDGNGHIISRLTIKSGSYLGLFGRVWGEVKDLGVVDVNITGSGSNVGGLVGENDGAVTRCYSTGTVSGTYYVGGLVGYNEGGAVTQCHSTGTVSGTENVGGLVGSGGGRVTRCWSIGTVSGTGGHVGGLVGYNSGPVTQCYSIGVVSGGNYYVGGLMGSNGGTVTQCYSTGAVRGTWYVGGLAGFNSGTVTQCYSTGAVSGTMWVGGLVLWNYGGRVSASFWDILTSGQAKSDGGTGKTTAEMQTAKTFLDAGWDFVGEAANGTDDIWWILEGKDYPRLWWEAHN